MKINGYTVTGIKLMVDGVGNLIQADRPCDCCLGPRAKVIKASLEGMWEEVLVCRQCLIKGGMFLDENDLDEELTELIDGRR